MDRIGIAVAPSDPDIVYVISETKDEGELWRSDDARRSLAHRSIAIRTSTSARSTTPTFASIRRTRIESSRSPDRCTCRKTAARTSARSRRDVHGDHQAMWIDPTNPKYILSGSDGGWQVSYDGGKNFEVVNTFPFTQFYHINYDMQRPYMACGGLQDNGNWCGAEPDAVGPGQPQERLVHGVRRRRILHRAGDGQAVARLLRRAGRHAQHHRHAHRRRRRRSIRIRIASARWATR